MEGVTARDVMSREFVGVTEGDPLEDVLSLMVDEAVDDVLVLRGSDPVGLVSSRDVLRTVADGEDPDSEPVESLMRPPPDPVAADSSVAAVMDRLSAVDSDLVPIADGEGELVGVVSQSDVIAAATSLVSEPRPGAPETSGDLVGTAEAAAPNDGGATTTRQQSEAVSTQGVCESCGTLSASLDVSNGKSLCPECRDV